MYQIHANCLKLIQFVDFTRDKYCEEAISATWKKHKNILKIQPIRAK
jgi:hypothetical protein